MAKKNVRRGKRKTSSSWLGKLGKWTAGTLFVIACFVASHYAYDYLRDVDWKRLISIKEPPTTEWVEDKLGEAKDMAQKSIQRTEEYLAETKERVESVKQSPTLPFPEQVEIPVLQKKRTEQIIRHEGYTVSYNSDYRIANWVAYELTAREAKSTRASRSNKFRPDPDAKGASALNEDYSKTGFDKGHLAPAGDMKWSHRAMQESFYFSNICPQEPGLNRGVWRILEEQCRLWASDNGVLYVATGPVIPDTGLRRLGKNRVGVPRQFYKVLCTVVDGQYEAIGFLFQNIDYKDDEPVQAHIVSVDSVEAVTGIDFFPALPDEVENRIEASVNESAWSF